MNISLALETVNWLSVLLAAVSNFLIGGLWYSSLLFKNTWLAANRFSQQDLQKRNMPIVFGLSFLCSLLIALALELAIKDMGLSYGATVGFIAGFCWVWLGFVIIALFENRSIRYVLVNGGYLVIAFTVMGLILGAFS